MNLHDNKRHFDLRFLVLCIALAVLFAAISGCVAPGSGWTYGGEHAVEVGCVAPFRSQPALAIEVSAEVRNDTDSSSTPTHIEQVPDGLASKPTGSQGGSAETFHSRTSRWDFENFRGRAGLRWQALPALALAAGTNEQFAPYARVVLEKHITARCAIGVEGVADRGMELLFGIRWSK